MRVFISGPIAKHGLEKARKIFNQAEDDLRRRGHTPVNPFKDERNKMTWTECMRLSIQDLLTCDGIYMLPAWHESKGALLERMIATNLKLVMVK